jgi:hypothetical protein
MIVTGYNQVLSDGIEITMRRIIHLGCRWTDEKM